MTGGLLTGKICLDDLSFIENSSFIHKDVALMINVIVRYLHVTDDPLAVIARHRLGTDIYFCLSQNYSCHMSISLT